ncbi:MAG TPA: DUF523 and DUF1722 domain-containing protein, partial [Geothermobacteraceae bacterium]|nr:DUF523 and DUF1722 domain-containing protein [Geothermobacteraceae bacterium]
GLPTPRPALRLIGEPDKQRLVFSKGGEDITEAMQAWAAKRVRELETENLCGFIFKKGSPSSGMERVKLYDRNGIPQGKGVGLFARAFMEHFPLLPVEEDGRLHDPQLRENFIESIFTLRRWRQTLAAKQPSLSGRVVQFHSCNKLLIMAHSPEHYRQLGKLVAGAGSLSADELTQNYQQLLLEALQRKTSLAKNINVMQHILGYFKRQLSSDEKREALQLLDRYRDGQVPLIVPLTLLNHYVRKYRQDYLQQQTYLEPHPLELKLRNHV